MKLKEIRPLDQTLLNIKAWPATSMLDISTSNLTCNHLQLLYMVAQALLQCSS